MATPSWRTQATAVFHATPDTDPTQLPGLLARARGLNPPVWRLGDSVMLDWLQSLENPASPAHACLHELLAAGVDPTAGHLVAGDLPRQSAVVEQYRQTMRASMSRRRTSDLARRLGQGQPRIMGEQTEQRTSWFIRALWAGRNHPQLPAIAQAFLDAGAPAGPPFPGSTFSAWGMALRSGRPEVLQVLARAQAGRPRHWLRSVIGALRHGQASPSDWPPILAGLEWFTRHYPPSPRQCAAVMRALAPDPGDADPHAAARLAWLSLPCAGLADPGGPHGHPRGFSPWLCLPNPPATLHRAHARVLDVLVTHPRWGKPGAWEARCPATGRDILATCVLDTGDDEGDAQRARRRLFAAFSQVGGQASPALVGRLAAMRFPPDAAASAWLRAHPQAWLECAPQGKTPWHLGPNPRLASWLQAMGVPAPAPDAAGVPGWVAGLVASLRRTRGGQDPQEGLGVAAQQLAIHAPVADWAQVVEGHTLRQWVQGHQDLAPHLPRCQRQPDLPSLWIALACGHRPSVERLVHALDRRSPLPASAAATLVDSWCRAGPAPAVDLAALLATLAPLLPAFPASACVGWLARAAARAHRGGALAGGARPDLAAVWALYPPGQPLARSDQAAVERWARHALGWRLDAGANGQEPWANAAWVAMPPAWRGALACALLRSALSPSSEHRGFRTIPEWVETLLEIFPRPQEWTQGASPAGVRRLVHQLERRVPQVFAQEGRPLPAALPALRAAARHAHLELEMAVASEKAAPRQRL